MSEELTRSDRCARARAGVIAASGAAVMLDPERVAGEFEFRRRRYAQRRAHRVKVSASVAARDHRQPPDPDIYRAARDQSADHETPTKRSAAVLQAASNRAVLEPLLATEACDGVMAGQRQVHVSAAREGVKFHDGTSFTAAVKASFDRRVAINQEPGLHGQDVESVTRRGLRRHHITPKAPNLGVPRLPGLPYGLAALSPGGLKSKKRCTDKCVGLPDHPRPPGTGPFVLTDAQGRFALRDGRLR